MKVRNLLFALTLCFVGVGLCAAEDLNIGTWKLNEAKSKIPAGFIKNVTVVYQAQGDSMKVTTDGFDGDGKPMHTEWTGKLDGKDYPIHVGRSGWPTRTRASRRLDAHMFESVDRFKDANGEVVSLVRVEQFSVDGRTMAKTSSRNDRDGQRVRIVAVYDRQ